MFRFGHSLFSNAYGGGAPVIDNDFVIRVKTDNAGTSASNQFTLPLRSGETYNASIDWGDGNSTNQTADVSPTHTYASAGTYDITISGTFPAIYFNNGGDKLKAIEIINFGNVGWTKLDRSFYGCTTLDISASATGNFDLVTDASLAFYLSRITRFPAIDFPICTTFSLAWRQTNIVDFPAINMPLGTAYDSAWFGISTLDTFGACNIPSATNTSNAFRGCGTITNFAMRDFYAMNNGIDMFRFTTLPTSDYSDILITQNANNPNNSVTFHGGNSNYDSSATSARTNLVSVKSWSITDGGLV